MPPNATTPDDVQEYTLPEGWTVWVGRNDIANDRLSLGLAGPNDWWFHVKGMPGSHVVLKAKNKEKPRAETLKMAAAIAAYHSKARTGGTVAVVATLARYVSKPRGAKPGTVSIRKETTYMVKPALPPPL
jgi:predicted ribosome quality control (RQC) complex YloA/Tae2 family protein